MNSATQPRSFYIVVPPGLEKLAELELRWWLEKSKLKIRPEHMQIEKGGLAVELDLKTGLALNHQLKIPSRILLRLADFGCRDFPKLFKRMQRIAWSEMLLPGGHIDIQVATHSSRLKIKNRIEDTCLKAVRQVYQTGDAFKASVFVRFMDDVCFISLDTSGEHLHKRGYRTHVGQAPLRENFAAALLYLMQQSALEVSRGSADICLIDPMVGSGTFLLEALNLFTSQQQRKFAYENFALSDFLEAPQVTQKFARSYIGFDVDAKVLAAAEINVQNWLSANSSTAGLSLFEVDLMSADEPILAADDSLKGGLRWVIANPPYGERLKLSGSLSAYYSLMSQRIQSLFRPDCVGLLLPDPLSERELKWPLTWKLISKTRFSNGGLPVCFWLFKQQV